MDRYREALQQQDQQAREPAQLSRLVQLEWLCPRFLRNVQVLTCVVLMRRIRLVVLAALQARSNNKLMVAGSFGTLRGRDDLIRWLGSLGGPVHPRATPSSDPACSPDQAMLGVCCWGQTISGSR